MTEAIKPREFAGVSHLGIPSKKVKVHLRLKIKYDTVQIYRNYADKIEGLVKMKYGELGAINFQIQEVSPDALPPIEHFVWFDAPDNLYSKRAAIKLGDGIKTDLVLLPFN